MSSLFETYEKQYGNLTGEITLNMGRIPNLKDDERQRVIHETSLLFDETTDVLEQMSLEVPELPVSIREKYATRLKCFEVELNKLKTEFKRPRYSPRGKPHSDPDEETLREDVLYDSDMRARLLDNTDRVARSTNRLEDGVRVALQTEEVGGHILTDLVEQREKLQRSRNRLRQADADLNRSSRILSEMTRRILQNRVVLLGIIILMLLLLITSVYLMTKPAKSSSATPPIVVEPAAANSIKGAEQHIPNANDDSPQVNDHVTTLPPNQPVADHAR